MTGAHLAYSFGCLRSRRHRRLDAAYVTGDEHRNKTTTNLQHLQHLYIGGFLHRIRRLDDGCRTPCLHHTQSLHTTHRNATGGGNEHA